MIADDDSSSQAFHISSFVVQMSDCFDICCLYLPYKQIPQYIKENGIALNDQSLWQVSNDKH